MQTAIRVVVTLAAAVAFGGSPALTQESGLDAEYFDWSDPQGRARPRVDTKPTLASLEDPALAGIPPSRLGVRWSGLVASTVPGALPFSLDLTGGRGRIWLDDALIWDECPSTLTDGHTVTVRLENTRAHHLRVEFQSISDRPAFRFEPPPSVEVRFLREGQPRFTLPAASFVSPAFIQGRFPEAVAVSVDGQAIETRALDDSLHAFEVPLDARRPMPVLVVSGNTETEGAITWKPTPLEDTDFVALRRGDSLLLAVARPGLIVVDGPGGSQLVEAVERVTPFRFERAGTHTLRLVDDSGRMRTRTTVEVADVSLDRRILAQIGATRDVEVPAVGSSVVLTGNSLVTVGATRLERGTAWARLAVARRGTPLLIARLGGADGPILAAAAIEEFALHVPGAAGIAADGALGTARTPLLLEPAVPDLRLELGTLSTEATFEDGLASTTLRTPAAGVTEGRERLELDVPLRVPPEEYHACWEMELYDERTQENVPVCVPPWGPGNVCKVLGYRTLIFSRADDESEDEALPKSSDEVDGVRRCLSPALPQSDNRELWATRLWPTLTRELTSGEATVPPRYRMTVSGPEPLTTRLDNPLEALYGGASKASECQDCDGACGPVFPDMDSGTIPGLYTTTPQSCDGQPDPGGDGGGAGSGTREAPDGEGSAPAGAFLVSKLDAHGTERGTTDKFPDYAVVLPRRGGTVTAPLIQMDSGGDRSVAGCCSLYGTVCPQANVWEFTAVATHPLTGTATGQHVPAGYRLVWRNVPFDVIETENGQPVRIRATLPAGRHFPLLEVYGPDPFTGQGNGLVGTAAIHSIVVENRPTDNVGEKNPDAAPPLGTAFHVTNHIGATKVPVDARIGIARVEHPHPDFVIAGRVSLDGHPQNQYRVGKDDVADLPQVVTVPGDVPQTYYVQGYQAASLARDDLKLRVEGQAQIEACASHFFFLDKSPCDVAPSGFPATVSWLETDIEPFNSSFPLTFQLDEPELKQLEEIDEPIVVAADNVAEDPLQPGDDEGYYIDRGFKGRVNFLASVNWDWGEVDGAYFTKVPDDQALTIDWHYAALDHASGRANFNGQPKLKDLRRQTQDPDPSGRITAILGALVSQVQLDFTKEEGTELRARAGDRFCIAPHSGLADSALGTSFWDPHTVEVEPGDKNFHIVAPNKPDPAQAAALAALRRVPDQIFDQHTIASFAASAYNDWKWEVPLGSDQRGTLEILALDGSLNAVGDGRRVIWSLEGGGALGSLDADSQAQPQEGHADELTTETSGGGWARIGFRQEHYGTCPWQFQQRPEQSTIYASVDGVSDVATYADVTLDDALPSPYPPLQLAIGMVPAGQSDPADARIALLDIARGERADVTATLTRGGRPLGGVPIAFTVNNGTLEGASVRSTNDAGEARVFVSGRGADLSTNGLGEVLISAQVSSLRASLDSRGPPGAGSVTARSLPRWRSSARPIVGVHDPVLVSDAFGARSVRKEALKDDGELASPRVAGLGGVEDDGYVIYPIFDTTRVTVRGEPNHLYHVGVFGPSGLATTSTGGPAGAAARYPFDTLTAQRTTPNVLGPNDADVEPPVALSADARVGMGALLFAGSGRALVPQGAATDARGGVRIELWARPAQGQDATLLFAPGQFRLALRQDGRLRLTTFSGPNPTASVDSEVRLPNGRWSFIRLRLSESLAFLTVGAEPDSLDTAASATAPGVFGAPAGPVEVGPGFTGSLDELSFAKGGFFPQQVSLIGLAPGNTFTTGPDGTFTFSFGLASRPAQSHLPETYQIVVFGSGEGTATVRAMPKDVWGGLLNVGRAFLYGEESLGKDAAWYERAAAWASSVLPIVSDARTLAFEIYKAATGCDSVSWMNVTFATAGLVLDVVSFGTAGTALRVTRTALATVVKRFLRETLENAAGDLLFQGAAEAFSRFVTVEVLQADGTTTAQLRPWVVSAQEYLSSLTTLLTGAYKEYLGQAFRSADDLFVGLAVFEEVGPAGFASVFSTFDETFQNLNDTADATGAGLVETAAGGSLSSPGDLLADLLAHSALDAPRPPRKRMPSKQKVLGETLKTLGSSRTKAILADPEATAGLKKLVGFVVKSSRDGETSKRLAARLQRSLDMFKPAEVKLLLKDFNTLHDVVKGTDLEVKLQALARDIAARGSRRTTKSRRALRSRIKGAVYALQEAEAAIQRNTLKRAKDGIEPEAFTDNRLFRDLTEILSNVPHYVELKAVERLSGAAVGAQLHRHYERVEIVTDVNRLQAVIVRSLNAASAGAQATIRRQAAAGIMLRNNFPAGYLPQVMAWVNKNVTFDTKPLKYRPL